MFNKLFATAVWLIWLYKTGGAPTSLLTTNSSVENVSRVWISLDYPSSLKTLTPTDVKQFLLNIQKNGDAKHPLSHECPRWKDIEWSIQTLVAAESEEAEKNIDQGCKRVNKSGKDRQDEFDSSSRGKEDTNYRKRRSLEVDSGLKMALFTLPPHSKDFDSEYEEVLVQLFYQYQIMSGEFGSDMDGMTSGMAGFIRELLNTTYPISVMIFKVDSYYGSKNCGNSSCDDLPTESSIKIFSTDALAASRASTMSGRPVTIDAPPGYVQPSVGLSIEYTQDLQLPQDAKSRLQTLLKQEKGYPFPPEADTKWSCLNWSNITFNSVTLISNNGCSPSAEVSQRSLGATTLKVKVTAAVDLSLNCTVLKETFDMMKPGIQECVCKIFNIQTPDESEVEVSVHKKT